MAAAISLGQFRNEIGALSGLLLVRDEPLEPLTISMPVDHVCVVLGASPYVALRSGSASVVLSHIAEIKRSVKGGRKSYKIVCSDYRNPGRPDNVKFGLYYGGPQFEGPQPSGGDLQ